MLLVVDIGNTHTAFGLFDGETLRFDWRIETRSERTADEHAATIRGLFELENLDLGRSMRPSSRRWCRPRPCPWSACSPATSS
jgi:pantothenate kinase type III